MRSIHALSDLVAAIHGAASAPDAWGAVLHSIQRATGAELGGLIIEGSGQAPDIIATTGVDPAMLAGYKSYYSRLDPIMPALLRKPEGLVITQQMVIDQADMRRTEFYNDWLRPQQVDDCLAVTIAGGPRPSVLAFAVPARVSRFDPQAARLLRLLVPHLRIAVRTHLHLRGLAWQRDDALSALGQLRCAVFLIDGSGAVVLANQAGEVLLRDAQVLAGGGTAGLLASTPDQSAVLRQMVARACGRAGRDISGGVLQLWHPVDGRRFLIMVVPLTAADAPRSARKARAMALVIPPEDDHAIPRRLLQAAFGLTPMEARVARILAQGHGVGAVAKRLNIGLSTARTHLLRIFAKTETRRQAELSRLLGQFTMLANPLEPDQGQDE
jgi:DNA-binding CsgD family transcriptional regulator